MLAIWTSEDMFIRGVCVIKNGDVRLIHAKKNGKYILAGKNGKGFYGWIDSKHLEVIGE